MIYLLDTKVCIAAMRGNSRVMQQLAARAPEDFEVSMISVFELFVGVFRCNDPQGEERKVSTFLAQVSLSPRKFGVFEVKTRVFSRFLRNGFS
jgi:predicted nucleic acid-binding protein